MTLPAVLDDYGDVLPVICHKMNNSHHCLSQTWCHQKLLRLSSLLSGPLPYKSVTFLLKQVLEDINFVVLYPSLQKGCEHLDAV